MEAIMIVNEKPAKEIVSTSSINNSMKFKMESVLKIDSTGLVNDDNSKVASTIPEVNTPVIGRFIGIFAKLDSYSVNKRFYSANFWKSVLASKDVQSDLSSGLMLGIMEHPNVKMNYTKEGLITARHPQNAGFVVKRLWIDGRDVMGEAYLLNTPLGRLLATYFLAKDKHNKPLIELYISARGFSKEDYFDQDGIDRMNPHDYFLEAFDVVMNPGIKGARVKMENHKDVRPMNSKSESCLDNIPVMTVEQITEQLRAELQLTNI